MSDEQIYDVLIREPRESGQILRFIMKGPIIAYWGEPENQEKLRDLFRSSYYVESEKYEILEIKESDVMDIVTVKKSQ